MKILVVDDSSAMRRIVIRTLRLAGLKGHEIIEATNGREGLEKIAESRPDLVLSDWNMPEMTGCDMLKEIRQTDERLPVGFITTETPSRHADSGILAQASFWIEKPFTPDDIAAKLEPFVKGA